VHVTTEDNGEHYEKQYHKSYYCNYIQTTDLNTVDMLMRTNFYNQCFQKLTKITQKN